MCKRWWIPFSTLETLFQTFFLQKEQTVRDQKIKASEAHLCPLSIGLDHEYDTGVGLVQCVSVKQSLARHTQLYFGDAGCRTTEAGRGGSGLLKVIHLRLGQEELPTGETVRSEAAGSSEGCRLE